MIKTIELINAILESAVPGKLAGAAFMFFNILTFGLLNLLVPSSFDDAMNQVEKLIDEENRTVYQPLGLYLVSPRKTGLLHVRWFISYVCYPFMPV